MAQFVARPEGKTSVRLKCAAQRPKAVTNTPPPIADNLRSAVGRERDAALDAALAVSRIQPTPASQDRLVSFDLMSEMDQIQVPLGLRFSRD